MDNAILWNEYTYRKQTYAQLAQKYNCSIRTIQRHLDKVQIKYRPIQIKHTYIIMDTTYFGRKFGLMVFMDYITKRVIYYQVVHYETNNLYRIGISIIKSKGINIQSITCDGRRGLINSFNEPTQLCQFHQQQIITRYLTRKPKHIASQSLRKIALQLTKIDKNTFKSLLSDWYETHQDYLKERSINLETGKTWYTHKRLRSAYRSLNNNIDYLFVYQEKDNQGIPNTTNALEGMFSELKRQLNCHKGLNYQRKLKFINHFLSKRKA
ncbi:MAG: hypothetical protein CSA42_06670 [Gammaproteobacteria bacterium]|nr:MAG: hypothetical protein CSA42_06670 [Gammaproteobacteria bacterium]